MSKTVFVFDDSPGWREVFKDMIRTAGLLYDEYVPSEGDCWIPSKDDLVEIHGRTDLFLIDLRLPNDLEGLDLLKMIRGIEERPTLPQKEAFLVSVVEEYRIGESLENFQPTRFFHKSRIIDLQRELTKWASR